MNERRISRKESKRDLRKDPSRDGAEPSDHPYKLFSANEVAVEMDVPPKFIAAIVAGLFDQPKGYANSFRPKALNTRLGAMTAAIPQVHGEINFYQSALERGCRSSSKWIRSSPSRS